MNDLGSNSYRRTHPALVGHSAVVTSPNPAVILAAAYHHGHVRQDVATKTIAEETKPGTCRRLELVRS